MSADPRIVLQLGLLARAKASVADLAKGLADAAKERELSNDTLTSLRYRLIRLEEAITEAAQIAHRLAGAEGETS